MFPVGGSRSRNSTVLCRQRRGCGAWKGSIQFCLEISFLANCRSLDIFSLFGIVLCETCWCRFNHFPSSIKLFSHCVHSLVYLLYYPQLENENNKNEKLRRKQVPVVLLCKRFSLTSDNSMQGSRLWCQPVFPDVQLNITSEDLKILCKVKKTLQTF